MKMAFYNYAYNQIHVVENRFQQRVPSWAHDRDSRMPPADNPLRFIPPSRHNNGWENRRGTSRSLTYTPRGANRRRRSHLDDVFRSNYDDCEDESDQRSRNQFRPRHKNISKININLNNKVLKETVNKEKLTIDSVNSNDKQNIETTERTVKEHALDLTDEALPRSALPDKNSEKFIENETECGAALEVTIDLTVEVENQTSNANKQELPDKATTEDLRVEKETTQSKEYSECSNNKKSSDSTEKINLSKTDSDNINEVIPQESNKIVISAQSELPQSSKTAIPFLDDSSVEKCNSHTNEMKAKSSSEDQINDTEMTPENYLSLCDSNENVRNNTNNFASSKTDDSHTKDPPVPSTDQLVGLSNYNETLKNIDNKRKKILDDKHTNYNITLADIDTTKTYLQNDCTSMDDYSIMDMDFGTPSPKSKFESEETTTKEKNSGSNSDPLLQQIDDILSDRPSENSKPISEGMESNLIKLDTKKSSVVDTEVKGGNLIIDEDPVVKSPNSMKNDLDEIKSNDIVATTPTTDDKIKKITDTIATLDENVKANLHDTNLEVDSIGPENQESDKKDIETTEELNSKEVNKSETIMNDKITTTAATDETMKHNNIALDDPNSAINSSSTIQKVEKQNSHEEDLELSKDLILNKTIMAESTLNNKTTIKIDNGTVKNEYAKHNVTLNDTYSAVNSPNTMQKDFIGPEIQKSDGQDLELPQEFNSKAKHEIVKHRRATLNDTNSVVNAPHTTHKDLVGSEKQKKDERSEMNLNNTIKAKRLKHQSSKHKKVTVNNTNLSVNSSNKSKKICFGPEKSNSDHKIKNLSKELKTPKKIINTAIIKNENVNTLKLREKNWKKHVESRNKESSNTNIYSNKPYLKIFASLFGDDEDVPHTPKLVKKTKTSTAVETKSSRKPKNQDVKRRWNTSELKHIMDIVKPKMEEVKIDKEVKIILRDIIKVNQKTSDQHKSRRSTEYEMKDVKRKRSEQDPIGNKYIKQKKIKLVVEEPCLVTYHGSEVKLTESFSSLVPLVNSFSSLCRARIVLNINEVCDEAVILDKPDIQENVETIQNVDSSLDEIIEIKPFIPFIDLTQNNLNAEKIMVDSKEELLVMLKEEPKPTDDEPITLYRSDETLNNNLEFQAQSAVIGETSHTDNESENKINLVEAKHNEGVDSVEVVKPSNTNVSQSEATILGSSPTSENTSSTAPLQITTGNSNINQNNMVLNREESDITRSDKNSTNIPVVTEMRSTENLNQLQTARSVATEMRSTENLNQFQTARSDQNSRNIIFESQENNVVQKQNIPQRVSVQNYNSSENTSQENRSLYYRLPTNTGISNSTSTVTTNVAIPNMTRINNDAPPNVVITKNQNFLATLSQYVRNSQQANSNHLRITAEPCSNNTTFGNQVVNASQVGVPDVPLRRHSTENIQQSAVPRTPRRNSALEENLQTTYVKSDSEILNDVTRTFTKIIIFCISIRQHQIVYFNSIKELNSLVPDLVSWDTQFSAVIYEKKIEILSSKLLATLKIMCQNRNIDFDLNKWFNELLKNAQMFSSIFTKMMLFSLLQKLMQPYRDFYMSIPCLKMIYVNVQRIVTKFEELKRPNQDSMQEDQRNRLLIQINEYNRTVLAGSQKQAHEVNSNFSNPPPTYPSSLNSNRVVPSTCIPIQTQSNNPPTNYPLHNITNSQQKPVNASNMQYSVNETSNQRFLYENNRECYQRPGYNIGVHLPQNTPPTINRSISCENNNKSVSQDVNSQRNHASLKILSNVTITPGCSNEKQIQNRQKTGNVRNPLPQFVPHVGQSVSNSTHLNTSCQTTSGVGKSVTSNIASNTHLLMNNTPTNSTKTHNTMQNATINAHSVGAKRSPLHTFEAYQKFCNATYGEASKSQTLPQKPNVHTFKTPNPVVSNNALQRTIDPNQQNSLQQLNNKSPMHLSNINESQVGGKTIQHPIQRSPVHLSNINESQVGGKIIQHPIQKSPHSSENLSVSYVQKQLISPAYNTPTQTPKSVNINNDDCNVTQLKSGSKPLSRTSRRSSITHSGTSPISESDNVVHNKSTHGATTPSHYVTTPSHNANTPSHNATTPSHNATTPSHIATTPSHIATTPSHNATDQSHNVTTPSHNVTTPSHNATTPSHNATTPRSQSTTPCSQDGSTPDQTVPPALSNIKSPVYAPMLFSPNSYIDDIEDSENGIIDLTWMEDADPQQLQKEVNDFYLKKEVLDDDEVILNQEQFPVAQIDQPLWMSPWEPSRAT